jgi:hypothetical protein
MRMIIAALAILTNVAAAAQTSNETVRRVMNNVGHESVECAAYMFVASAGLAKTPKFAVVSEGYSKVGEELLKRAAIVAEQIGQKLDAVDARLKMSTDDMMKLIDNDFTNISILLNRYSEHCKIVAENFEARMQFWTNKVLAEEEAAKRPRK